MKFESIEQLISYSKHDNPNIKEPSSTQISRFRNDWSGAKDWDEACKNAREGKNVEKINGTLQEVTKGQVAETMTMSVAGAYVDVGSYLGGEPECMVNFEQVENPKFATIVVDLCESAYVDEKYFTNKAITVCYLVDTLQNNGFRVKIIGILGDHLRGRLERMEVIIKRYEQPLSLGQVSGCIVASFFRRICFGWIERIYWDNQQGQASDLNYGRIDRTYAQEFKQMTDHIVIESHTVGDWDMCKEGMVRRCNEIIQKLNEKY